MYTIWTQIGNCHQLLGFSFIFFDTQVDCKPLTSGGHISSHLSNVQSHSVVLCLWKTLRSMNDGVKLMLTGERLEVSVTEALG